jgi:hypothetical protein
MVVGPVEVLEHEHQWPPLGERLEEAPPGGESFFAVIHPGVRLSGEAHKRTEVAFDPAGVRRIRQEIGDSLCELVMSYIGRVGLEDAGLRLDHLPERPKGHPLAVRKRAALPPIDDVVGVGVDRLGELPHETALTDARNAGKGEELRPALPLGAGEGFRQQAELRLPADERTTSALLHIDAITSPRRERLPHRNQLRFSLRPHGLALGVLDLPLGRPVGRLTDEDPVRRSRGLEARRGVDDVAGDHAFAFLRARVESDDRLARVDADADVEIERRVGLVQFLHGVADGERRPDRSLRVVLVCDGSAEDGHDGIADELLHGAAEALDLRAQAREVGREHAADVLGVELLGAAGEPDEVGEEHGDDLALLAACVVLGRERGSAVVAEARALGVLLAANRANRHAERVRVDGSEFQEGLAGCRSPPEAAQPIFRQALLLRWSRPTATVVRRNGNSAVR